jgi:phage repressor protein C with HTH and peptisase S24 domain
MASFTITKRTKANDDFSYRCVNVVEKKRRLYTENLKHSVKNNLYDSSYILNLLVEGDSMYPTLKNGAMIMVNRNLNGLSDGIYVMRHDHNLLVKRLQLLPDGIIKVKSDNKMYEPWEINKKHLNGTDIELIGRVVWSGQRM